MSQTRKSLVDLDGREMREIGARLLEFKENGQNGKLPAIYKVRNRQGKSECEEFIGAMGGSSRKNNSRPQVKFSVLGSKVSLASAMDAVYQVHWKAAHPEEAEYRYEGEISHLCHFKWCINPHHLVREAHITNCERRDNCSRFACCCESQGRNPPCV